MAAAKKALPPDATPGERWIAFLRGYGPINRVDGMFAEALPAHAKAYGFAPLLFEHPKLKDLLAAINPKEGRLTNVILTGTAGDGKTTLCHDLWREFGGDDGRATGADRSNYGRLEVDTPDGPRLLHFIFEFSGWCPQGDQEWTAEQLDLLERFAASTSEAAPREVFLIAANDGKLGQAWDSLPQGPAAALQPTIETLLAEERETVPGLNLLFLNLSRLPTADLMAAALECLLTRGEWSCFETEADDAAFGPDSPLTRNFRLLQTRTIQTRILALAELIDCNSLHVPIREVLLLLVNALLGSPDAAERVATTVELRAFVAAGDIQRAALYSNLFGANLPERRRDQYAVFRHLGAFRVGLETTNQLDGLIVFGADDPNLQAMHAQVLAADPYYADHPEFEALRRAYLRAEDDRAESLPPFLSALTGERRRLFFRLEEFDTAADPWKLSIFHHAGSYRRNVLGALRSGRPVDAGIVKLLVQGLNRIWTGLMAGDLDRLYLSTGLDVTSARISDIFLYELPLRRGLHGEEVAVIAPEPGAEAIPLLRVAMSARDHVDFPLRLTRYEFLLRVADGALPGSFSKECNEDVLAFKSQVLSKFFDMQDERSVALTLLNPTANGGLERRQLGVTP